MNNSMGAAGFMRSALENLAQSYIDSFFEADAKSKQNAGTGSVIQRRQLWNCCEWCARLAGSYPYEPGKYPKDIFRRHENCRCMVTVKTDRSGYTDVWSKKEYESQREARIAREQEILTEQSERVSTGAKKNVNLKPGESYEDHHKELFYEEIRNRKPYSDARHIAANVPEFSEDDIEQIRRHMFLDEVQRDGRIARFDADYDQAQAWQRLVEGKDIRESDIVLLHHELMEAQIMAETGCTYEAAHDKANAKYNWYALTQKGE